MYPTNFFCSQFNGAFSWQFCGKNQSLWRFQTWFKLHSTRIKLSLQIQIAHFQHSILPNTIISQNKLYHRNLHWYWLILTCHEMTPLSHQHQGVNPLISALDLWTMWKWLEFWRQACKEDHQPNMALHCFLIANNFIYHPKLMGFSYSTWFYA